MISLIKTQLHRDICRDPLLHSLVLNLYLNGEEYPNKVDDYFPMQHLDNPELVTAMQSHIKDEAKHSAIYRKMISKLGHPVIELEMPDVYNHVIRKHTRCSFKIAPSDSADLKTEKVASFMAHLHFLEKRIARSLKYHLDSCQCSPVKYSENAVAIIQTDESRHEIYTKEAVYDLLPRHRAKKMMALHREAEQQANTEFSAAQLSKLVQHYSHHFPDSRRWIYRWSAKVLEWSR